MKNEITVTITGQLDIQPAGDFFENAGYKCEVCRTPLGKTSKEVVAKFIVKTTREKKVREFELPSSHFGIFVCRKCALQIYGQKMETVHARWL